MIVKIKHTWYQGRLYNLDSPADREEFIDNLRGVVQFANQALIELAVGDAGDSKAIVERLIKEGRVRG